MCIETMATKSKSLKTGCLRRNIKPGSKSRSKMRWRNLRLTFEEEASKQGRANMSANVRKYLRREQKRIQLANLVDDMGKMEEMSRYEAAESHATAFRLRHSAGGMAPANTTQYLMANVYEDISNKDGDYFNLLPVSPESCADVYGESLSPLSLYVALDSAYESCLAFQQRDFEEVFSMCAKC